MTDGQFFASYAIKNNAFKFGDFILSSERYSPYIFDLGGFNDGPDIQIVANQYSRIVSKNNLENNILVAIPEKTTFLISAITLSLYSCFGTNAKCSSLRAMAKTHGTGRTSIGHPIKGANVVILDDALTTGNAIIKKGIEKISQEGGKVSACIVAFDRQEKVDNYESAKKLIEEKYDIPVFTISSLEDLIWALSKKKDDKSKENLQKIVKHREENCLKPK
ncbi:MAG: hypothetical protein FJZ43_02550 [Candidatus Staskawiczbacteria bacterium]|nr:hypothetical protein [Candidatus Staskawiczbacteria bacterium]